MQSSVDAPSGEPAAKRPRSASAVDGGVGGPLVMRRPVSEGTSVGTHSAVREDATGTGKLVVTLSRTPTPTIAVPMASALVAADSGAAEAVVPVSAGGPVVSEAGAASEPEIRNGTPNGTAQNGHDMGYEPRHDHDAGAAGQQQTPLPAHALRPSQPQPQPRPQLPIAAHPQGGSPGDKKKVWDGHQPLVLGDEVAARSGGKVGKVGGAC